MNSEAFTRLKPWQQQHDIYFVAGPFPCLHFNEALQTWIIYYLQR